MREPNFHVKQMPANITTDQYPRNIIFIVADSLRYDTVYRNNDIRLPYLETNAVQFHQARSGGCWTLPATASMFTGMMPHEHGATAQTRAIRKDVPTLAEQLKQRGYETHQITANIATTEVFGLERGFDRVSKIWQQVPVKYNFMQKILALAGKPRLRKIIISGDDVMARLTEDLEASKVWLQLTHHTILDQARQLIADNEQKNVRSFVFINLMETHFPYHIADTFQASSKGPVNKLRELVSMFHYVNQTFLQTGKLHIKPEMLKVMRNRQRTAWEIIAPAINQFVREMHEGQNNLVLFCGDHGDNFGEDGWLYHFSNVTDGGNKVPLFWLNPSANNQPAAIQTPISARDLYSSLLRAAGNPKGISVYTEPNESLPVIQSYWYNCHGKTLPKYKYNQICFVDNEYRYLYRMGKWMAAPITKSTWEPVFEPIPDGINPLLEAVSDVEKRKKMEAILKNFEIFSDKIMADKKKD